MLCTFCGTENRPEYKFCGTCGVRMERRQVERREHQSGVSTKCAGCGHVNEPGMKFCGMCGTRVERRLEERRGTGNEPRAAAIANAQLPPPDVRGRTTAQVAASPEEANEVPVSLPRRGEPAIFRNGPQRNESSPREVVRTESGNGGRISGPSFLGLNSEPDNNGEVEYLLEDEPTGGGLRKLLLLVILAAILGLVFVQWRSSFKANPKPPAPTKSDPSTPSTAPQGSNQPTDPAAPSFSESPKVAGAGASAITNSAASELKAPRAEPTALESTSPTPGSDSAEDSVTPKSPADNKAPATDKALLDSDSKATEARIPDYKPSAALVRAQQYIRGTSGVAQNCEQGLLYLKAATDKSDPGADIQMAALYSSGICVKQDRVMAYRWFNSAHELQPANVWIQRNMDQLWAQMSTQERRLAGY